MNYRLIQYLIALIAYFFFVFLIWLCSCFWSWLWNIWSRWYRDGVYTYDSGIMQDQDSTKQDNFRWSWLWYTYQEVDTTVSIHRKWSSWKDIELLWARIQALVSAIDWWYSPAIDPEQDLITAPEIQQPIQKTEQTPTPVVEKEVTGATDYDTRMMSLICQKWKLHGRTSPLCNNRPLYHDLAKISRDKGVPFWFQVWVSYRESHIWANFAPSMVCAQSNNRWWLKHKKPNSCASATWNASGKYNYNGTTCRLYPFDSVQDYWTAQANTFACSYAKKCGYDAACISINYVWWTGIKRDRAKAVNQFNIPQ